MGIFYMYSMLSLIPAFLFARILDAFQNDPKNLLFSFRWRELFRRTPKVVYVLAFLFLPATIYAGVSIVISNLLNFVFFMIPKRKFQKLK